MDYAVYGYLQEGRDSAARAAVAQVSQVKPSSRGVVAAYNRTAMAARLPLERGDWAAAANFPPPGDSLAPIATALARFTRAIGNARSGHPDKGDPEVKALDSLATALEKQGEPYWSRVVRIKHDAAGAWLHFASGDTTGALAIARTAADSEEVTEKHQVTPGELLPARELQGDMLLLTRHYPEARAAYKATLQREPNRARSLFGKARSAELAGDRSAAAEDYKAFLQLMAKADRDRPEVAMARRYEGEAVGR
jgi:tetratricopeptide (TPR) repeat protein